LKSASHFIAVDQGLVDGHFKLYQVDPETVGQYTGLKDRNGREIYEGDILRDDEMGLNVVRWEDGSFWLEMFYEGNQSLMEHLSDYNEVCEIIGNIYESHELLKGEETA
jgi:uncharacterized phage protein (TIGR01671 family)